MSHPLRYVKVNYGDHCFYNDSSFKRYNRAHLGGDTLIFNFFNGCGCGGYMPATCGCGFWGGLRGFWGGLGAGLGMGLMGMGMNMLCGWLGGLMGGCGGGSQGGSSVSPTGGSSVTRERVLSTGDDKKAKETTETVKPAVPSQEEDKRPDDIKKAGISEDIYNAYKDAGITDNNLIILLYNSGLTKPEDITKLKDLGLGDIDASKTDKSALDGIKNPETLGKLPKEVAVALLKHIGYVDDNGTGKISNDYKVLLLLQAAGIPVEVEHRAKSYDQDVKGVISNVKNTDGVLSYDIDCNGVSGATIQGKYTFTAEDDKNVAFHAKKANPDDEGYEVDETVLIRYQSEGVPMENVSDRPLVKSK